MESNTTFCTSSLSNTSTIKKRNKTSRSTPIKRLLQPRTLLNVDRTENRSGRLEFYTDLQVQTGTNISNLRFFLSDLGEHKAILGYPWFAVVQPKIDWKKGWIDHTQLPIIL